MALEAELGRDEAGAAPPASIEEVLKLVRELDPAIEEVAATPAANRNGLKRSGSGGNMNCYVEAGEAAKGRTEKLWVPLTQDWSRTDAAK